MFHPCRYVAFINSFFPLLRPGPWMLWGSMEKSNLLLGATFRESYQGAGSEETTTSPSSTVLQELVQKSLSWINYCRFVARMTRDTDHDFSLYLWFARDALEDCTWCSCTYPCAAIVAFEEVIDVCGVWMFHSDADFGRTGCGGDGVRKWEGKSGFCRERWLFWEGELHSITQDEDRYPPHVRNSARRTGATMELVRTESDCT
ncbi:hypothetical protein O6H91_05G013600 [Diphasiastrum complanatum]|uniref:Uncharacterized protein n=1 Tax=Diphasiastrum complanatum TaxID=34168 RepID=A0ACC2DL16_DIPCM|nr:hypothetical protein O6H91_05G013600 [Diphasiastrum complanatum]